MSPLMESHVCESQVIMLWLYDSNRCIRRGIHPFLTQKNIFEFFCESRQWLIAAVNLTVKR